MIYDGNPNGMSHASHKPNWLCFTAAEAGSTFTFVRSNGATVTNNIQISRDHGDTWENWDFTVITLQHVGDKAWLRGTGNGFAAQSASVYHHFVMTGKIKASGSVYSLIYNDDCYPARIKTNTANLLRRFIHSLSFTTHSS